MNRDAVTCPHCSWTFSLNSVLTTRESEVLALSADGLSVKDVAWRLSLAVETVKTHLQRVYVKLHANSREHAVAIALREGFIA